MLASRSGCSVLLLAFLTSFVLADDQRIDVPDPPHELDSALEEGAVVPAEPPADVPVDGNVDFEVIDDHQHGHDDFWHYRRGLADKHAPAMLMGDHVHECGEWMIELKTMNMYMEDNRIGTRTVADGQAFGFAGTNNAATPTQMTMEMQMMHIMYGWSDDITLYVMLMHHINTMDHLRNTPFPPGTAPDGSPFTTSYDGFGDISLGALMRLYATDCEDLIFNFGWSVPTGGLDRTTEIPNPGTPQEFPYPMRPGTGTVNARPGLTYKRYFCRSSFGAQIQTMIPLGDNDEGYSVGEEYRLNFWYSHLVHDRLAFSYRVENAWKGNIDGADADLAQGLISTNRPDMRGGQWVNFGYGAMLLAGDGHLFNFEVVHPVHQDLDGIQLEHDWWFAASWSKAF